MEWPTANGRNRRAGQRNDPAAPAPAVISFALKDDGLRPDLPAESAGGGSVFRSPRKSLPKGAEPRAAQKAPLHQWASLHSKRSPPLPPPFPPRKPSRTLSTSSPLLPPGHS